MITPKFELLRVSDDSYKLINNHEKINEPFNIYLMFSPDDLIGKFIKMSTLQTTELFFKTEGLRPYILIESTVTKIKMVVAERTLYIPGMNNFRDMGGYETDSGLTIKWGKLFRGDHLYNADNDGIEKFRQLGIKTIIDYRSDIEILKYPNKDLAPDIKIFQCDPSAHAAELAAQFNSSKEDEDSNLIKKIIENKKNGTLKNHASVVLNQYKAFVAKTESKHAFSKMLNVVLQESSLPIFQHCRGGKDRTGYGAMLILGILGVDKNTILYDYLLTAKNREKRNEYKMAKYRELTNDEDVLNHLYSFIVADLSFLEASINEISANYGSITEYAVNELGINKMQIDVFKDRLLHKL